MRMDNPTLIAIVVFGGMVWAGIIAIIGGFLHARRGQSQLHAERMKALELGRELPEDPSVAKTRAALQAGSGPAETPGGLKAMAIQCYTTTGWVAGLGMLFAVGAVGSTGGASVSVAVAAAAGAIGVTGMICGTILAAKAGDAPATPAESPRAIGAPIKPSFDPEAV